MDSFLALTIPLAIFAWAIWLARLRTSRLSPPQLSTRVILGIVLPLLCGIFLWLTLSRLAAHDVRSDRTWIALYWTFGMAWVGASQGVLAILGISMRDDVLERRNTAAAYVVAGQLVGLTCCFAGANIGEGPGPEVVLFCAVIATVSLVLLWILYDRIAVTADAVTIDRDVPTGICAGGWFAALGIVLGAGIAGDWVSVPRTLLDFAAYDWMPVAVAIAIAVVERVLSSRPYDNTARRTLYSFLIAFAYVFLAASYVYKRGLR